MHVRPIVGHRRCDLRRHDLGSYRVLAAGKVHKICNVQGTIFPCTVQKLAPFVLGRSSVS
jgi:hypothetical protein